MYFVYALISKKDKSFYIGFSKHIKRRVEEHNNGKVASTKTKRPLVLLFCEGYLSKKDALRRERYFKSSKGKTTLKQILRESLRNYI